MCDPRSFQLGINPHPNRWHAIMDKAARRISVLRNLQKNSIPPPQQSELDVFQHYTHSLLQSATLLRARVKRVNSQLPSRRLLLLTSLSHLLSVLVMSVRSNCARVCAGAFPGTRAHRDFAKRTGRLYKPASMSDALKCITRPAWQRKSLSSLDSRKLRKCTYSKWEFIVDNFEEKSYGRLLNKQSSAPYKSLGKHHRENSLSLSLSLSATPN